MSEFIEIISPNAKKQITDIMAQVDLLANKIKSIPNFQLSNTPSGADDAIKKLTADLALQAKEIDNLKTKLAGLNQERQKSVKLTTQQKVDNAIILKEEKQLVTLTSAYADAYVKLNAQRTIAKTKLQDLIASERASNKELREAQKEFDKYNKKVAAADKAVGRFSDANRKINGLASSVGNLMTAFGVGTGIYLAVDIAKNIYETTKKLQGLDLALKMVSGTQKEFAENQAFIANTSQKWGLEIKSATEQYTKFYTASKGILSDTEIKDIFASLAKSGSLLGASAEKQEGTFVALEQMMSKGKVTAEELTKQLGNAMPGALRAMAMAYMELHPQITDIQKAEQALFADMRKGAIDSKTYVPLYVKNYEKLVGIEMVDKVETLQAAQNRLKNSWTELIRSMNESETSGIGRFFTYIISMSAYAIGKLDRVLSSWNTLQNKADTAGKGLGQASFSRQLSEDYKPLTAKEKSNIDKRIKEIDDEIKKSSTSNQKQAELRGEKEGLLTQLFKSDKNKVLRNIRDGNKTILEEYQKEYAELDKKTKELAKNLTGSDYAYFVEQGVDPKRKEELKKLIAEYKTIFYKANAGLSSKPLDPKLKGKTDAQLEAERKADEKRQKAIEEALKTEYDLKMAQLDQDKIILEQGLENEKLNYSERLNFAYLIAAKELEIADTKYKEEQRLLDFKYSDEKEVSKQHKDELLIADINYWKDKEKIAKEAIKRIQDVQFKPQYERQQLADPEKYGEGVGVLGESQTQDMVNLWQKGQDKIKETEEDRIKRLKALRDVLNDVFQEFGQATGFESTMDMFAVIGKNGEDFWTNLTDKKKISEIEWNEWGLAITTVAQDAMNVIDQADEERYQRRLERLEKDKETALKYAGDSAAAKEKIEAQYEKKRKALEVKEFKRKQKMAMANIAIDTAQAIMAVIAKSGQPWMSVVVGALGAVQLAMVASQKPPEYWKGTDNAEAGLAFTQERGAEIILDKHKRVKSFGSDGGAQLTMMEKGDKVKTASETKRIMFDAGLNSILSNNGIKEAKIEIVNKGLTVDEMDMVIGKHFANITTQHVSFDKNGIQQWNEKNSNRTIRNSARGSGKGFIV